jgi:hypothetical protein
MYLLSKPTSTESDEKSVNRKLFNSTSPKSAPVELFSSVLI